MEEDVTTEIRKSTSGKLTKIRKDMNKREGDKCTNDSRKMRVKERRGRAKGHTGRNAREV